MQTLVADVRNATGSLDARPAAAAVFAIDAELPKKNEGGDGRSCHAVEAGHAEGTVYRPRNALSREDRRRTVGRRSRGYGILVMAY